MANKSLRIEIGMLVGIEKCAGCIPIIYHYTWPWSFCCSSRIFSSSFVALSLASARSLSASARFAVSIWALSFAAARSLATSARFAVSVRALSFAATRTLSASARSLSASARSLSAAARFAISVRVLSFAATRPLSASSALAWACIYSQLENHIQKRRLPTATRGASRALCWSSRSFAYRSLLVMNSFWSAGVFSSFFNG